MTNLTAVKARFNIPTDKAVRLKFEDKLDEVVKYNLAQSLVSEIIAGGLLDIQSQENNYGTYQTVFEGTIFVSK